MFRLEVEGYHVSGAMLVRLAAVGALRSVSVVLEHFVVDLEHPAALLLRTSQRKFFAGRGRLGVHASRFYTEESSGGFLSSAG